MLYIVALSGGIASGKSTVANLFAKRGVPVIDADMIARQVVAKGTPTLKHITAHFGKQILLPSGELDRAQLRETIFNHVDERRWLNHYLHPIIQQETQQQINQLTSPYIIWVVPLLIENNLQTQANRTLIIDTPPNIQIERLQHRDNIDENLAKNMISSQTTNKERLRHADDIITNNTLASDLVFQVDCLHKKYLKLSQEFN